MNSKFWILIAFSLLIGCGGGTTGTGDISDAGRPVSVKGLIQDTNAMPLTEVQIISAETTEETLSTSDGNFTLDTKLTGTTLELIIRGQGIDFMVRIYDLPDNASVVTVSLTADIPNNVVAVTAISIEELNPAPVATPSQGRPTPLPIVEVQHTALVEGKIAGQNGEPIAGASIKVKGRSEKSRSGSAGKFSLLVVEPGERLTLVVKFEKSTIEVPIKLPSDADSKVNVQLRVVRPAVDPEVNTNSLPRIEVVAVRVR